MSRLIKEIPGSEFKKYLRSHKACRPGPAYELEGKYGVIHFNFKSFLADKAIVHFRRRSGNGVGVLVSGPNIVNLHITSKIKSSVTIPIDESGDIFVKRTQRSSGNIDILSISLYAEQEAPEVDWSAILRRCEQHSCLKLVNGKLMASEGAFIKAGRVNSVQTDPPNCFKKIDGKEIKFLSSCEIVDLDVSVVSNQLVSTQLSPISQTVHFEPEPPVIKPPEESVKSPEPRQEPVSPKPVRSEAPHVSHLIFDSAASGFTKSFSNNDVKLFPKHIVLGHRGEYKLPMRSVQPGRPYLIVVEAANVRGNGRFTATLSPSDDAKNKPLVAPNRKQTIQKRVVANHNANAFHLVVGRHPGSTGDVMITRITCVADTYMPPVAHEVMRNYAPYSVTRIVMGPDSDNPILQRSLQFAKHSSTWKVSDSKKLDIQGKFSSNTYSGVNWFHRIKPLLKNIDFSEKNSTCSIQDINSLVSGRNNLFLEECLVEDITEDKLNLLKTYKKIITPSVMVEGFLSEKLPNCNVVCGFKPWPICDTESSVPVPSSYFLVFNRNSKITSKIIDAHKPELPKIVLVGARGRYDPSLILTNEYLGYSGLLHLIKNAKAVIDLPLIDYDSGLLRLCVGCGTPMITSNFKAVEYIEAAVFINREEEIKGGKVPSKESITDAMQQVLQRTRAPESLDDYCQEMNQTLKTMFL